MILKTTLGSPPEGLSVADLNIKGKFYKCPANQTVLTTLSAGFTADIMCDNRK